jgi:4-amino-4-deoxy-L-arabinose transferase-like glycosyltransferase
MGFAALVKGPVGFILPLLVSLVYLFLLRDWRAVKRMRLLTGMILVVVVVLLSALETVSEVGVYFCPKVVSNGPALTM